MTPKKERRPDIDVYTELIDNFVEGPITAAEFAQSFLRTMKSERRMLGGPIYPLLQELFEEADAYVEDPNLRTDPEDLNDEQLHACASRIRRALRELGSQA